LKRLEERIVGSVCKRLKEKITEYKVLCARKPFMNVKTGEDEIGYLNRKADL